MLTRRYDDGRCGRGWDVQYTGKTSKTSTYYVGPDIQLVVTHAKSVNDAEDFGVGDDSLVLIDSDEYLIHYK